MAGKWSTLTCHPNSRNAPPREPIARQTATPPMSRHAVGFFIALADVAAYRHAATRLKGTKIKKRSWLYGTNFGARSAWMISCFRP